MARIDFMSLAQDYAVSAGQIGNLPVIEKEILHYEILNALDAAGYFSYLRFQGGTCLRLCYGSQRYSEDLDFSAGDSFDKLNPHELAAVVKQSVEGAYATPVRVHEPQSNTMLANAKMARWVVVVDTAPQRPDLPSQRIKIEVASVPAHTLAFRQMEVHYPGLPVGYDAVLCACQTREEIFADKLVSFANTDAYVRHRDIWDIAWLRRQAGFDKAAALDLVRAKHEDYGVSVPLSTLLGKGAARLNDAEVLKDFAATMHRFLPPGAYTRTIERAEYQTVLVESVKASYAEALAEA